MNLHRSRIAMLVGAVIGVLSLPLPLVRFPASGSVNSIEGDGWPAVVLIVLVAVLALFGDRAEGLAVPSALTAGVASGLATVFAVLKLADASDAAAKVAGATIGTGVWALIAAALITLVGVALTVSRKLS